MFLEGFSKTSSDFGHEVHELQESKVKTGDWGRLLQPAEVYDSVQVHVCGRIEGIDITPYTDEVNVCAGRYDSDMMCIYLWEYCV